MISILFAIIAQPIIYQDIYIDEPIVTKAYVWQNYVDGKKRYVPLINGYIPEIYERFYPDYAYFILDYRKKIIYRPTLPLVKPTIPLAKPPSLPTREELPDPLPLDESESFQQRPSSVN